MAQSPQNSTEIQRLIRLSAASRLCLSNQAAALRQRLDVPHRVARVISSHPAKWLGGTALLGLVTALLLRRKAPRLQPRRALSGVLLAFAIKAARPIVKTWLLGRFEQFVISLARAKSPLSPQSNRLGAANHS